MQEKNSLNVTKRSNLKESFDPVMKDVHYMHMINSIGWLMKCSIHIGLQAFFQHMLFGKSIRIKSYQW